VETNSGAISIRRVRDNQQLLRLSPPSNPVNKVQNLALSPDDTQLAVTYSGRRELLVWDLRLLREPLTKMDLDWAWPSFTTDAGSVSNLPTKLTVINEEPGTSR
jgi:WD40 repeat protein